MTQRVNNEVYIEENYSTNEKITKSSSRKGLKLSKTMKISPNRSSDPINISQSQPKTPKSSSKSPPISIPHPKTPSSTYTKTSTERHLDVLLAQERYLYLQSVHPKMDATTQVSSTVRRREVATQMSSIGDEEETIKQVVREYEEKLEEQRRIYYLQMQTMKKTKQGLLTLKFVTIS